MTAPVLEITELLEFDVSKVAGVGSPANGTPILLMKATAPVAKGARDCPKCSKNYDADHQGSKCENCGTDLPDAPAAKSSDEANSVQCPMCKGEEQPNCKGCNGLGQVTPDKAKQLAAKSLADEYEDRLAWVAKGGRNYSAGERKQMADDGRALPDGSYPINDEHDLHSAAILQRSGHGDVKAAAKHIGKRAKELGVANPLDTDTAKSEIAKEEATVDTGAQTGELSELVKAAIAEATTPLKDELALVKSELAKVKATPVPGGPVMSHNVQVKAPGAVVNDKAAKDAAYYRQQADLWSTQDRDTADGYRELARKAEAQAQTA